MSSSCLFRNCTSVSQRYGCFPSIHSSRLCRYSTSAMLSVPVPTAKHVGSETRSLYFDTIAPTLTQAEAALYFFKTHRPRKSWVANEWRKQAHSASETFPSTTGGTDFKHGISSLSQTLLTPEIAFLGRSNTGKSSLLNALLDSPDLCRVGSKPGKTTTMHAWTLSPGSFQKPSSIRGQGPNSKGNTLRLQLDPNDRLTVLDMPGYGHGSRNEWGIDIVKYLTRRRQLRRAMVLLNPKHGVKEGDEQILRLLTSHGIPHQIVACKCDTLPAAELEMRLIELRQKVHKNANIGGQTFAASPLSMCVDDVLAVGGIGAKSSKATKIKSTAFGIDDVRWAILRAAGLEGFAAEQWTGPEQKRKLQQQQQLMPTPINNQV